MTRLKKGEKKKTIERKRNNKKTKKELNTFIRRDSCDQKNG
jgi:hypothetical protein